MGRRRWQALLATAAYNVQVDCTTLSGSAGGARGYGLLLTDQQGIAGGDLDLQSATNIAKLNILAFRE